MDDTNKLLTRIDDAEKRSGRDPKAFSRFIAMLPKAEIHLHVEALITADSLQKLNIKNGLYPECKTADQLKTHLDLKEISDLNEMIDQFIKIQTFFRNEEDFALINNCISSYMEDNNITYMEVHFSPSTFLKNGLQFDGMISSLEGEIDKICDESGKDVRIIVDVSRTFGVENAMTNLKLVKEYQDKHPKNRIIAIGLGGSEKSGTPKEYGPVFKQAHQWNIRTVAHGGEDSGPEQLWATLKELEPLRIGHGTSAHLEEALMDELKKREIPLEVCPSSNVITGRFMKNMSEHPIKLFYEKGIALTLNTDDPLIFGIQLNDEYQNLYDDLDFSLLQLVQLVRNTYKYSFMREDWKERSMKVLEEAIPKALKEIYPEQLK